MEQLRIWRGDLRVRPENFAGSERGSRFYPLLYLLTRVHGARDFGTGLELRKHLLGKGSSLQLHHVFPKAMLNELGHGRRARNALANFCFLTQETNLAISKKRPVDYFPSYEEQHPGVLASQWIPEDRSLWDEDRYEDFLAARRELLAQAANDLFDQLLGASGEATAAEPSGGVALTASGQSADDLDPDLRRIVALTQELGLPEPLIDHEISDETSGEVLAMADLAWPEGIQTGRSEPLAYLGEPDEDMESRLGALGYRFFLTYDRLVWYLEEVLGTDIDGDETIGQPGEPAGPG